MCFYFSSFCLQESTEQTDSFVCTFGFEKIILQVYTFWISQVCKYFGTDKKGINCYLTIVKNVFLRCINKSKLVLLAK